MNILRYTPKGLRRFVAVCVFASAWYTGQAQAVMVIGYDAGTPTQSCPPGQVIVGLTGDTPTCQRLGAMIDNPYTYLPLAEETVGKVVLNNGSTEVVGFMVSDLAGVYRRVDAIGPGQSIQLAPGRVITGIDVVDNAEYATRGWKPTVQVALYDNADRGPEGFPLDDPTFGELVDEYDTGDQYMGDRVLELLKTRFGTGGGLLVIYDKAADVRQSFTSRLITTGGDQP
jgi:hypothetical protein